MDRTTGQLLWLRSADIEVGIAPEHGADVVWLGRPDGPNVLFQANWDTPLRSDAGPGYGDSRMDWLANWRGGWQELFPNAGKASSLLGVQLPHHGEVSSAKWSVDQQSVDELVVSTPTRLPVTLTRRMRVEGNELHIMEEANNESDLEIPVRWTHHPSFAAPPNTRIDLPDGPVVIQRQGSNARPLLDPGTYSWPRLGNRDGTDFDLSHISGERQLMMAYRPDLTVGLARVVREDGWATELTWDLVTFPHVALWIQVGDPHFPWYGRASVVAVEPCSAWPGDGLDGAIERQQALVLRPRTTTRTWLKARVLNVPAVSLEEQTDSQELNGHAAQG